VEWFTFNLVDAALTEPDRDIGPGDVWHMEDKHGKGHHTMVTSKEDFQSMIIQYE
jgi:hypothetical protein